MVAVMVAAAVIGLAEMADEIGALGPMVNWLGRLLNSRALFVRKLCGASAAHRLHTAEFNRWYNGGSRSSCVSDECTRWYVEKA
jgi:hypothetical protein